MVQHSFCHHVTTPYCNNLAVILFELTLALHKTTTVSKDSIPKGGTSFKWTHSTSSPCSASHDKRMPFFSTLTPAVLSLKHTHIPAPCRVGCHLQCVPWQTQAVFLSFNTRGALIESHTRTCTLQGGMSPAVRPMTNSGRPVTGFARPGTSSRIGVCVYVCVLVWYFHCQTASTYVSQSL